MSIHVQSQDVIKALGKQFLKDLKSHTLGTIFVVLVVFGLFSAAFASYFSEEPNQQTIAQDHSQVEAPAAQNKYSEDDLIGLELSVQNLYCDSVQLVRNFSVDMNSGKFDNYIEADGNDVPKMRALGNKYRTVRDSLNVNTGIETLSKSPLKNDFADTIRLLNQSITHLNGWLNGNANLASFEEFKQKVVPSLQSYNVSIDFIPSAYEKEMGVFFYAHPELETIITRDKTDIKETCEFVIATMDAKKDKEGFISLNPFNAVLESDNAYRLYGKTSNNCTKVKAKAVNEESGKTDEYYLKNYKYGDTEFKYGIREDWNNLSAGSNTYTFSAECDDHQVHETSKVLTYTEQTPVRTPLSTGKVDYYTNTYGQKTQSPTYYSTAPPGASARCGDGTYSFSASRSGTCSHHGGVSQWISGSSSSETYTEPDDSTYSYGGGSGYSSGSGHDAGYEWAEENDIEDADDCDGNSNSFNEGCQTYVEDNYSEETDE